MDAPNPPPVSPPAIVAKAETRTRQVVRVCDDNGCRIVPAAATVPQQMPGPGVTVRVKAKAEVEVKEEGAVGPVRAFVRAVGERVQEFRENRPRLFRR